MMEYPKDMLLPVKENDLILIIYKEIRYVVSTVGGSVLF